VANAGIASVTAGVPLDDYEGVIRKVIDVNQMGVMNTGRLNHEPMFISSHFRDLPAVFPALALMKQRGSGHILIIASMAAFLAMGLDVGKATLSLNNCYLCHTAERTSNLVLCLPTQATAHLRQL
jgi:NAD(P)-dependent dehydrogenase (short-subunit alcohol dehydrogenase family)